MDWIGNDYSDMVVHHVQEDCRQRGHSLVVFTLGSLSYQLEESALEDQILPFLKLAAMDRLLIGSSQLVRNGGDAKLARIMRKARPRPTVSLGAAFEGCTLVLGEHDGAVHALLEHLWEIHGYRRFAWVGGAVDNPVAAKRRAVMLRFLADHGASLPANLDVPGDFNLSAGREAGYRLGGHLDSFDVVVAANDSMALGVREILGAGIPVTGIDNGIAGFHAGLTTVDTDLRQEIRQALALLSALPPGVFSPPAVHAVRLGQTVVRSSCGCAVSDAAHGPAGSEAGNSLERIGGLFESILESRDMPELASCLNKALPGENVAFWRFLPTIERGDGRAGELPIPSADGDSGRRELVVHSLFRERELYGYFMHDISNQDLILSEWLRINLCLTLQGWQRQTQNIHAQRLLRSEIERQGRRQRDIEAVLDSLPVWIVELDRRLRIRYTNRCMQGLLGVGHDNSAPWPFLSRIVGADQPRVEQGLQAVLRTQQAAGVDFRMIRHDGQAVSLLADVRPLGADGGSNLSALNGALHGGGGLRLVGLDLGGMLAEMVQPVELLLQHFEFGKREQELIGHLVRGLDTPRIAARMGTAESTVRVQLHKIYSKTGVSGRRGLIELLAGYHARTNQPHSLTQVLLARFLSRNDEP